MVDAMEMDATAQIIVAIALGVLTIVWNQQRSVGNLRQEFQEANKELRREFHEAHAQLRQELHEAHAQLRQELHEAHTQLRQELHEAHTQLRQELYEAHAQLRQEFHEAHTQLREALARNGERLARIDGHLGIGVDAPRAPRTGGTRAQTDEAIQTPRAATG